MKRFLEESVDKWGDGRSLRKNKKETHKNKNHDHRDHPPQFPVPKKGQQLTEYAHTREKLFHGLSLIFLPRIFPSLKYQFRLS